MKRIFFLLAAAVVVAIYSGLGNFDEAREASSQLHVQKTDSSAAERNSNAAIASVSPQVSQSPTVESQAFDKSALELGRMSGDQLLALYKRAMGSANIEDKFLGSQALGLCMQTIYTSHALESSQADADKHKRSAESMREMRRICGPFATVHLQDALRDAKKLALALEGESSPFSSYHVSAVASDEEKQAFQSRLNSNVLAFGPSVLLWEGGNIADWIISRSPNSIVQDGRFVGNDESKKVHAAVSLAMCHSGYDCSSSSLIYMNLCARAGACGLSINDGILGQFNSSEDRAYVEKLSMKIGAALMSKDLLSLKSWYVK